MRGDSEGGKDLTIRPATSAANCDGNIRIDTGTGLQPAFKDDPVAAGMKDAIRIMVARAQAGILSASDAHFSTHTPFCSVFQTDQIFEVRIRLPTPWICKRKIYKDHDHRLQIGDCLTYFRWRRSFVNAKGIAEAG